MQALFMAIFAALIVVADQITKYLTVTNIAPYINPSKPYMLNQLKDAYHLTQAQIDALPSQVEAIPGLFHFSHTLNDGAAWSSFSGMQWFFIILFVVLTVAVVWEYRKKALPFTTFERWCIAAIYAGGLGNMIDRVRMGFVIDMIELEFMNFPIFNVADCFITCGCIGLLFHLVFFNRKFWKDEKKK